MVNNNTPEVVDIPERKRVRERDHRYEMIVETIANKPCLLAQ